MVETGPNPPNPDQARREAVGKDDASKKPVELYAMPSNSKDMQIVQMQILHIQNQNTNNSNLHTKLWSSTDLVHAAHTKSTTTTTTSKPSRSHHFPLAPPRDCDFLGERVLLASVSFYWFLWTDCKMQLGTIQSQNISVYIDLAVRQIWRVTSTGLLSKCQNLRWNIGVIRGQICRSNNMRCKRTQFDR